MNGCPNCGSGESQVLPVYEDDERREAGEQPTFIACKSCNKLMRTRYLRDQDNEIPPQATLTKAERKWLSARGMVGNQHSNKLSIIEWQCLKGAALYFGVSDWKAKPIRRLQPRRISA